jgi:hypothetical protein
VDHVKLMRYGESEWLIGDDAADALLEYAVELARADSADSIEVAVLATDGRGIHLAALIGPATMMTAEDTDTPFAEPDNVDAVAGIRDRARLLVGHPIAGPTEVVEAFDDLF